MKTKEDKKKIIILIIMVLYVFSPIDIMPGCPLDDMIVLVAGYLIQRRKSKHEVI
jgi:uncharacterized membrane protein YkvA (DUF1232 family)